MAIIHPRLSQLRLSPLNQRRVKPSAIESMADDIAAHGLLQNLVAYDEDGLLYVFAGGRRYRALKVLQKRKSVKGSDTFPVELRDKSEAIELSLIENEQREDMHPADRIRSYGALRDTGMSAEDIAARSGTAVSFVYKMLRLSALAPSLIDLIAKDQLGLDAARALTLTDSHDQQVKVCKAANGQAHAIRRMLTTEKVATTNGAFLFIGADAYAEKGGTVTPDLFSEGSAGYADQPEIVQELAEDKLDSIADEYRRAGWHEVKAALDRPYDLYAKGSMYPATRQPTDDEAARIEAIDAEIEQIAEAEGEDSDRIEPLSNERDAITASFRAFNAEQIAVGGVALWVSHDGSLGHSVYRAKAEPRPKKGVGEPQPLYSNSLVADLSRIKTRIVQEAVAADPALALDMVLDSLAGQLLHGAHSYQMAIDVQAKTVATDVADELMATSDVREVEETMADRFASIPAEGRFEAIRAMSHDDKMVLFAGLVAMTVDGTLFAGGAPGARHHHFEQIARATGVDIAARWQAPIALFDKMRRAALIDLLRAECGDPSADNCASIKKKADLAVNVSGRLAAGWLPAPMQIGAFDQPERDELDGPEADDFDGEGAEGEDMEADEMA
ncbi:ParB N-terminal domain-containing protein [Sphingomonas melonis]|uniref:ParB/RepB/Spo0J family partition protein n=1 Tax=Sphingomonas melonis TaxID=152682 RepID=UPI001C8B9CB2|nr:ParB N-terminal domain-containing protein [Sphingomonas melonis]MBX8846552.1 ParB N-terminal domain-containing protein [Sphingomonas melonis]MBX8855655.1 ParB N-terminal domain-containing protein [Sphingomonas melonis]